uniref:Uncharacterized protein n=1 Tax=Physcomitrium patens TaxID=3218 RepID=A0A2K1KPZ0_PHYPA|nr:hypothetical protein PHYPA_006760 [Physcomitrium patens]
MRRNVCRRLIASPGGTVHASFRKPPREVSDQRKCKKESAVARSVRIINCKCISRELSYSVLPKISQCRAGLITLTGVTLNGKQSRRR